MDIPKTLIADTIKRGTILHSYMFEDIDHGKFFVVIGVSEKFIAGFFFINSRVNIHLEGKQEQLDMQYPLRQSDYDFLRYDSFLSATQIQRISIEKLSASIKEKTTEIIGEMKQEHIDEVLAYARKSPLFSPKEIEMFLS